MFYCPPKRKAEQNLKDSKLRKQLLTYGYHWRWSTGVEMAGAIAGNGWKIVPMHDIVIINTEDIKVLI